MPAVDEVLYRRWRNLRHRYLVEVLDVQDYRGTAISTYRTVKVKRVKSLEERTWPVEVFLRSFEPVGRKLRKKTAWELLQE
jgi:hypothetical protein